MNAATTAVPQGAASMAARGIGWLKRRRPVAQEGRGEALPADRRSAMAWTKAVKSKPGLTLNEVKTKLKNARMAQFDVLG